jgi:hypothetical protein
LAAFILVSLDNLFSLDLLPGTGVVRPKSDATCCLGMVDLAIGVMRWRWRYWSVGEILWFGSK